MLFLLGYEAFIRFIQQTFVKYFIKIYIVILLSISNKYFLFSSPPAYPVNVPLLPIILWHGIIIPILFFPTAFATALTDFGLPILWASSLYDIVVPYSMFSNSFHTFS